ncbi:MAG: radical SAM protein [Bacteroidales bacterium]|nr:radical SAM protein [Bacteroidales bacterium]
MSSIKNILLVSANAYSNPYPVYPLGISYLHTYLKKQLPLFNFSIFDFNRQSLSDFKGILSTGDIDIVGVSLRNIDDTNIYRKNSFIDWYRQVIETVRNASTAKVIIGGPGFSIFPVILFNILKPDFGIKGEGEESLLELIGCIDKNADYKRIEGLVYKTLSGRIKINPRTTYLNSLELAFDKDLVDYYWSKSGMLNIQTKRGCPYNCIYCSYPVIEGRKVRTLDTGLIVNTLKDLYFEKGITYVFFTDSVFNISNEYNIKLAEEIIKSGVKVSWGAYFSPHNLTYEDLSLFKRAGLTHIEFGSESFSDMQLENYGKHFTFDDILKVSMISSDLGIFFAHFLILGGYGETDLSLNQTFENSKKIPLSVFFPYIGMRIYPDTELYNIAIAEGRISSTDTLLEPTYYISKHVNLDTIKERALATGKKWIFPDFDDHGMMEKFRSRNIRGPLWEFLRF